MIHEEHAVVPKDFSSSLTDVELSGALFILHEKKKGNSFWKPWLDTLTDDVGLILSFSDDEMKELEGSLVSEHFTQKLKALSMHSVFLIIFMLSIDSRSCQKREVSSCLSKFIIVFYQHLMHIFNFVPCCSFHRI